MSIEIRGYAVVRMLEDCSSPECVSLSSCEVVEYELFEEVPEHYEISELFDWSYPDSIIGMLSGKGCSHGLFGVDFKVVIDYHQNYWKKVDCETIYDKFEVTELEVKL